MTLINNNYLILPKNSHIPYKPVFREETISNPLSSQPISTQTYPADTIEISTTDKTKKTKISTASKVGLTTLGLLGGLATIAIYSKRKKYNDLLKLYDEKLQLQNLALHIDFEEAKSVEEGIKFAKEVLKIEEVDSNFTLDAINFANRGIVKVSNANYGRLFIPKKMHYFYTEEDWAAAVIQNLEAKDFGELYINSRFFEDEFLDKYLKNALGLNKKTTIDSLEQATEIPNKELHYTAIYDEQTKKLMERYKNDTTSLSITEKQDLINTINEAYSKEDGDLIRAPLSTLMGWKNQLLEAGINVDIDAFKNLDTEKQAEKLNELLIELQEKRGRLGYDSSFASADSIIYHEMGHLQDFAKNLKELYFKLIKPSRAGNNWNDIQNKHIDDAGVELIGNRWQGLTYEGYKELFEKNPTEFKKRYPDLYEFLTNQEYQQTAGKISGYAQTSIGEFIAETYARMVRGDKLPNDVMKLYEKYNGPKLGG